MGQFTYFGHEPSLWLVGIVLFAVQVLAREAGGWVRRLIAGSADARAEDASDKGLILSGVLGLLALMIAFTFSLAMNRYEARRNLVVAEANAIGTAEMRVQILASPQGAGLARRLHAYARTRLQFGLASAEEKPTFARSSAAILGYALTGTRSRQHPSTIVLFALLTLAILLILDLDRPQNGTIRIDQPPMTRLVAGFASRGEGAPTR